MNQLPDSFNFADHVFCLNRAHPARAAYIDDHGELSYGDLEDRARRLAGVLAAVGVRREERVLLLLHDTCDWPVCFLGCLYAGVVPVAVNTLLTVDDYAYMLAHSRAQAALVSGALLPVLSQAMARGPHEVGTLLVSQPVGKLHAGTRDLEAALEGAAPRAAPAPTHAHEPGFWLYSSGSTGKPKGTVHTHGNLWWTAELYGKPVLGLQADDVCFSAAKLYFAYGLGNALTFPLCVGATVVLMAERPTPDAVFQRWVRHRPTVFFGAPTGFAGMLASPRLPARSQVALRMCSSAGEALPAEIAQRFKAHFGCDIIDGIGSTEMLHIFLSNRPGDVRWGTTGKPVPGYEIALRGEDGLPVRDGEVGDLYIRGPSAALMYWSHREKTRDTFQGAWTKSLFKTFSGIALECNREEWMLRMRRTGSCPCKQPGRPIARFHSNPSGKCLAGRSAALRRLWIAALSTAHRALHPIPARHLCDPEKVLNRLLAATSTPATPRATTPMPGAATTCSRSAASTSPHSRWSTR